MSSGTGPPPVASVLVGLVNRGDAIDHLLDALERQQGAVPFEVVIAERLGDGSAERLGRERPQVRVLSAAAGTTLPELRTMALEASRGRFVFVTEDHTVPPPGWIGRFVAALEGAPERVVAVGGPVDNLMRDRAVDWAAFLIEYWGFLPPQPGGEVDDAPGMNVAYRREAFSAIEREALTRGFWESTVHPRLRAGGRTFLRLADVVIGHRKRFGFFYFLAQRYHYSRYFGGARFGREQRAKRAIYSLLALGLAGLVLARIVRSVGRRPAYRRPLVRSLPAMACFLVALAVGESVGYLAGPGGSLAAIE